MTQTAPSGDNQLRAEAVRKDDLLERQLENLFSDLTPPEPNHTSHQRSRLDTGTSQPLDTFAVAGAPPLFRKGLSLKSRWATLARSLSALAPFMVLFFMVAERTGLAWPVYTLTPPAATLQAVAHDPTKLPSPSATPTAPTATSSTQTPTTTHPTLTAPPATHTPTLPPATSTTIPATATAAATPTLTPAPTDVPAAPTPVLLPTAAPTATRTSDPQPPPTLMLVPPSPSPTPALPSPTRLLIPAINLEAPIVRVGFINYEIGGQPVSTWAVPEWFAVGWHHTSALPGQIGNTVLNGHQNVYGRVFRDLNKLQAGDEILVYVGDAVYRYRVAEQHLLAEAGQPLEVRIENARWIMPTQDERLTLVTCAPDTSSTHRLIVVAFPAD